MAPRLHFLLACVLASACAALAQSAAGEPGAVLHENTSLLACPEGERPGYFYYHVDQAAFRGASWCEAAQASVDWGNATDTLAWRLPYRLEACTPGVGWTYSQATFEGGRYVLAPPLRDIHLLCLRALPAPPAESPPLGCALGGGGFASCPLGLPSPDAPLPPGTPVDGGPSADAGEPGEPSEDPLDEPGPPAFAAGGPQGCRADALQAQPAAESVGNPVFAGNGNKVQREADLDGPPGLALVRHYNSSLPGWVHNHGMQVLVAAGQARVQGPDGRVLHFTRSAEGAWTAAGVGGRLTPLEAGWRFVDDEDTQLDFDAQGRWLRVTPRGGLARVALRDGQGRLQAVTDAYGRSLRLAYDEVGRLVQAQAADGTAVAYAYDAAGRLARVTLPDGNSRQYLYEDPAYPLALTGLVDERGLRVASWGYDAQGRAVLSQRAGGPLHQRAQEGEGWVRLTDGAGLQRLQQYQRLGQRLRLVAQSAPCLDCRGDVAQRSLDPLSGLGLETQDFLGVRQATTWDAARRLPLARTRAVGWPQAQSQEVVWHPQWRLPLRITEAGRATEFRYDEAGRMLMRSVSDLATGAARTWHWRYDEAGRLVAHVDPRGGTWAYAYDAWGQLATATDPLGQLTRTRHDLMGRLLARVDPDGLETRYAYHPRGWLTEVWRGGESTRWDYSPTGRLLAYTGAEGETTRFDYDAADQLMAIRDGQGNTLALERDGAGRLVRSSWRDAQGRIAWLQALRIGALGQVDGIEGGTGTLATRLHDANGRLAGQADGLGGLTRLVRDALGRVTRIEWPDQAQARLDWGAGGTGAEDRPEDATGVLVAATDPRGVRTDYAVNALGDRVGERSPDIGVLRLLRDAAGDLIGWEDAQGRRSTLTRDARGRPVQIELAGVDLPRGQGASSLLAPPQRIRLAYDPMGRLLSLEDGSGASHWQRDALGRVSRRIVDVGVSPGAMRRFTLDYSWGPGGLAAVTYPSGLQLVYRRQGRRITGIDVRPPAWRGAGGRDASGRGGAQRLAQPWLTDLVHTPWGQPAGWRWASGDQARRSFDPDGWLLSTEFARYRRDAAGRIVEIEQDLWTRGVRQETRRWQAGYDSRHRLIAFTGDGEDSRYRHDANGNRLAWEDRQDRQEHGQVSLQRRYHLAPDSNRQLGYSQVQSRGRARHVTEVRHTLSPEGRLVDDGLHQFSYDAWGRLVRVRWPQEGRWLEQHYLHNALGQRMFKSEPGPRREALGTAFVHGEPEGPLPAWALLGEYDGGSALGRGDTEYLWLPTDDGGALPVGLWRGGRLYAVHSDGLGTPRQVMDEAGWLLWQWPYAGFGERAPIGTWREPEIELNLRFPGQYADTETGTVHNHWRSQAGAQGRYLQPDPLGLAGGWNRFAYAEGDPFNQADPWGLDSTRWWPGPGRSFLDGPRNGNWGGKHWSGGVGGGAIGTAPPLDSADACYMRHDLCYEAGGDKSRCDAQLVKELRELPEDLRQWALPPRPGTEEDTRRYRTGALLWFQ